MVQLSHYHVISDLFTACYQTYAYDASQLLLLYSLTIFTYFLQLLLSYFLFRLPILLIKVDFIFVLLFFLFLLLHFLFQNRVLKEHLHVFGDNVHKLLDL